MASPIVPSTPQLQQLTLNQKFQYIQNAKAETEVLQQHITHIRKQIMDTSLPQAAREVGPLRECKFSRVHTFKGHRGKVHDMKLTSDGQTLVSVAQDGILLLWDASTGLKINAVALSNCWVIACAVSPSGRLISTGGLDNACTVYGIDTIDDEMSSNHGESTGLVSELDRNDISFQSASTLNNNRKPSKSPFGKNQNNYQMSGLWPHLPRSILKGHKGYISSMTFPEEDRLLSASGDMSVAYWDLNRNERIAEFVDRNLGDVNSVCVHPSNPHIFVSGSLKTAKVWDTRAPTSTQEFFGHEDDINVVKMFPDGNAIVTGSDDTTCRLFDMRSDCQLNIYADNKLTSAVTTAEFSPSGRILFVSYEDGTLGTWDVLKGLWAGDVVRNNSPSGQITSIQVNHNGSRIYTGSWDSTIRAYRPL